MLCRDFSSTGLSALLLGGTLKIELNIEAARRAQEGMGEMLTSLQGLTTFYTLTMMANTEPACRQPPRDGHVTEKLAPRRVVFLP
jgi:hypothetical protein